MYGVSKRFRDASTALKIAWRESPGWVRIVVLVLLMGLGRE